MKINKKEEREKEPRRTRRKKGKSKCTSPRKKKSKCVGYIHLIRSEKKRRTKEAIQQPPSPLSSPPSLPSLVIEVSTVWLLRAGLAAARGHGPQRHGLCAPDLVGVLQDRAVAGEEACVCGWVGVCACVGGCVCVCVCVRERERERERE